MRFSLRLVGEVADFAADLDVTVGGLSNPLVRHYRRYSLLFGVERAPTGLLVIDTRFVYALDRSRVREAYVGRSVTSEQPVEADALHRGGR